MTTNECVNIKFKDFEGIFQGVIIAYCESDNSCTVKFGEQRLVRVLYAKEVVEPYLYCCWPIELEEV